MTYFHVTGKVHFWHHRHIVVDDVYCADYAGLAMRKAVYAAMDRAGDHNGPAEYFYDTLIARNESVEERDTRERKEMHQSMLLSGVPTLFVEVHA